MALIYEGVQCAVCKKPIDIDGSYFCTTALPDIDMAGCHELSDAPIHWDCLWKCKRAEELVDHSFKCGKLFYHGNKYWKVWLDTHDYDVATNGIVVRVHIRAGAIGLDLQPESWLEELVSLKTNDKALCHLPVGRRSSTVQSIDEIRQWQAAEQDGPADAFGAADL